MTTENETRRDELAARRLLAGATRDTLDEVSRHSLGRTGKVARAIEAGLASLRYDAVLAPGHREALEEFAGMVSESTPSTDGGGIGMRCVRWRDAVLALLGELRPAQPDPLRELFVDLTAPLTPQQAEQLAHPLSGQQRDLFQPVINLTRSAEVSPLCSSTSLGTRACIATEMGDGEHDGRWDATAIAIRRSLGRDERQSPSDAVIRRSLRRDERQSPSDAVTRLARPLSWANASRAPA